jgi:nondiscriminating aspartyl-tRNA synthetase
MMHRTPIIKIISEVGKDVSIFGWVRLVRNHGKVAFVDVRDYSGMIQVVFVPSTLDEESAKVFKELHGEDVVEIIGTVQGRKEGTENKELPTGSVEVLAKSVILLSKAAELPIDMGAKELNVELPTLLDYRSLTLRHPKVQAIFKIQEIIIDAYRQALKEKGFTEFTAPAIVPTATEGGSEVFKIKYFDYDVFLGQSPQFYKQIMVGAFERVFTIGKVYRAEPSVTTRHLTEYISLDAEFGFINDFTEIMDMLEYVMRFIFKEIETKGKQYLDLFGATIPTLSDKIPRVTMHDAKELIYKRTGRDIRKEPDLDPQGEKDITAWAKEEHESELVFVTHYPTSKRPFYTFPDPKDPEVTHSFDLIGRGVEWVTGGRRINDYNQLLKSAKKWGNDPKSLGIYLQAFKFGMPPEGGFALGAERITMNILGLQNLREASAFPRDMERVDVRLKDIN